MMAVTPLWQDGDGKCCGTGGMAILSFEVEGARLVLANITVRDARPDAARRDQAARLAKGTNFR